MSAVAIIPARGGSKRIPRKNIRSFLGKPIIAYSIELAIRSGLFDEVMVSTDDQEIANIAEKYGARIPFLRSPEASDDHATTAVVITEVLDSYALSDRSFTFACCIYPTAPLLKVEVLRNAFELLKKESFDTVFPTVPFGYPIWRSLKLDGQKSRVLMNWPEYIHTRSQDLPVAYHDAGQFYWLNCEVFKEAPLLFGDNSGTIVLSEMEVQDIDNINDWTLAELKATLLNAR